MVIEPESFIFLRVPVGSCACAQTDMDISAKIAVAVAARLAERFEFLDIVLSSHC
jgi:hypothetical protein